MPHPPSSEEIVRTLRHDAVAVLRGIDALRDRLSKELNFSIHDEAVVGDSDALQDPAAKVTKAPVAPAELRELEESKLPVVSQHGAQGLEANVVTPQVSAGGGISIGYGGHGIGEAGGGSGGAPKLSHSKSIASLAHVPAALLRRWDRQVLEGQQTLAEGITESVNVDGKNDLQMDSAWKELVVSNNVNIEEYDSAISMQRCEVQAWFSMESRPMIRPLMSLAATSSRWLQKLPTDVPFTPVRAPCIVWDMIGLMFVLYDLITIPIFACWELRIEGVLREIMAVTTIFWSVDIFVNFNMGFFTNGRLETRRLPVTRYYLKRWFFVDLLVVCLDTLVLAGVVSSFTGLRLFRVLKLARIAKLVTLVTAIEDLFCSLGIRWMILVTIAFRNFALIFLLAHAAACSWFYIGRSRYEEDLPSWLASVDIDRTPGVELYVRSLYWVLGHLTAAPVDPEMTASSHTERSFSVSLVFLSIMVLGVLFSSMANAIDELGKLNYDYKETKRQLQSFLKSAGVDRHLSQRIIHFAMHAYERHSALSLDSKVLGLLSKQLKSELAVSQRSQYFSAHPLFRYLQSGFLEVFHGICEAFVPNVFAEQDFVFNVGSVAKGLYVTHVGIFKMTFRVKDSALQESILEHAQWVSEISLYTKFVHMCTLQSVSYSDVFFLSCQSMLDRISVSPECIGLMYRYVQQYVSRMPLDGCTPLEVVSMDLAERALDSVKEATKVIELEWPGTCDESTQAFVEQLKSHTGSAVAICEAIPMIFKELDPRSGLFAKLESVDEADRAISSMMSIILLVKDRYDEFVALQSDANKLSIRKWQELQAFMQWVDITDEQLHAALTFLAIRGLGKVRSLGRALPVAARGPEDIVLYFIDEGNILPSMRELPDGVKRLVRDVLITYKIFSLPQMLQGENTPYQLQLLQHSMSDFPDSAGLLKLLLLCQVGVMCGLAGAKGKTGSVFMNEANSSNIIAAITLLQALGQKSSQEIYWGYILYRGRQLGLHTEGFEQIALCRLACLCRMTSTQKQTFINVWNSLDKGVQHSLVDNLLGDGICETTYLFTFLPDYFANAIANRIIGFRKALLVLADLLHLLRVEGCAERFSSRCVVVDLQELAVFAMEVTSTRAFQSTPAHIRLVQRGHIFRVLLATKNKERVKLGTWAEDHELDMPCVLRRLEWKVDLLETPKVETR